MEKKGYKSEINKTQKRSFVFFLLLYILSFVLLFAIGDTINSDGYFILALIVPIISLISIIGISLSFYFNNKP